MLMPREIATLVYNLYWRKWFKRQDVEPMLVSSMPYWNKDFQNVVAPVARHMGVSLEAMKIRLVNLGLLIDTTVSKNDIRKVI
jgi:LPS sulfotransferase NodH